MKIQLIGTFLTFLALSSRVQCAAVGQATSSSPNYQQALEGFLLAIRKMMPYGYAPLKIPVLAPFRKDFVSFNITNEYFSFAGSLRNLVISGLDKFRILGSTYNSSTNRSTYDIVFTNLHVLGEYGPDFHVLVGGLPVFWEGNGVLDTRIIDFRIIGDYTFAPSQLKPNGLGLADMNMKFSFSKVKMNNWNNLGDFETNDLINQFYTDYLMVMVEEVQSHLPQFWNKNLLPFFNIVYSNISMENLIQLFVAGTNALNSVECSSA